MQNDTLTYFLFPHIGLSEKDFLNFSIFLPRLHLLEITRPAAVPDWGRERFPGLPSVQEKDLLDRIRSCLDGYRAFAREHGGAGGILGFLGLAPDETGETRFRIQEDIRGKCPPGLDPAHTAMFQAAVFLEIARELDEKEYELEASFTQVDMLEKEFRGILGITAGEDDAEAEDTLSPSLIPDTSGQHFMLPRRIRSWFRLFGGCSVASPPVFVANHPEVVDETIDLVRAGHERTGKNFLPLRFSLGAFPRLEPLGQKQFRSLTEAPDVPELLDSYRRELETFLREAATAENLRELEPKSESLRHRLDTICRKCDIPRADQVRLGLVFSKDLSLGALMESLGLSRPAPGGFDAGNWPACFLSIE